MALSVQDLAALPAERVRQFLPQWIGGHVDAPETILGPMREELAAVLASLSESDLESMREAFHVAGEEFRLYPANPSARRISRGFMHHVALGGAIVGGAHLPAFLAQRRRVVVANHLSYADTQATDSVLHQQGHTDLADRLVAIAGPKVYTSAWRRIAAIGLNTRKTAQSTAVATEQGALSPRELAVVALETIADCERRMDEGWIILLYPEGTRSRTGELQPFLRAAGRYLQIPGLQVMPMAQTGTGALYAVDAEKMTPHPVQVAFGPSFATDDFSGKSGALDEAERRVRALLG